MIEFDELEDLCYQALTEINNTTLNHQPRGELGKAALDLFDRITRIASERARSEVFKASFKDGFDIGYQRGVERTKQDIVKSINRLLEGKDD